MAQCCPTRPGALVVWVWVQRGSAGPFIGLVVDGFLAVWRRGACLLYASRAPGRRVFFFAFFRVGLFVVVARETGPITHDVLPFVGHGIAREIEGRRAGRVVGGCPVHV